MYKWERIHIFCLLYLLIYIYHLIISGWFIYLYCMHMVYGIDLSKKSMKERASPGHPSPSSTTSINYIQSQHILCLLHPDDLVKLYYMIELFVNCLIPQSLLEYLESSTIHARWFLYTCYTVQNEYNSMTNQPINQSMLIYLF